MGDRRPRPKYYPGEKSPVEWKRIMDQYKELGIVDEKGHLKKSSPGYPRRRFPPADTNITQVLYEMFGASSKPETEEPKDG